MNYKVPNFSNFADTLKVFLFVSTSLISDTLVANGCVYITEYDRLMNMPEIDVIGYIT